MSLYIVNVSTGWRLQENAPAVPCGEVVDLLPEVAADGVAKSWLIAEDDPKYLTDEHRATLAVYREKYPELAQSVEGEQPPTGDVVEDDVQPRRKRTR